MYLGKVVCDIAPGATEIHDDNYRRDDGTVSVIISSWQARRYRLYPKRKRTNLLGI